MSAVLFVSGAAQAQTCLTDQMHEFYKQHFPQIEQYEQQLNEAIAEGMKSIDLDRARGKGTFNEDDTIHVPLVVHIIHDYGTGTAYRSDNEIYQLVDHINEVFLKRNADTSDVITPFKKYIGNPKVMFHLATKDPQGNPTIGITRRRSYLTDGGDDQAKYDQWDPSSYLNLWVIERIGRGTTVGVVAAYATLPASAASFPYNDGVIGSSSNLLNDKTIPHEFGHIFNLYHTWGNHAYTTDCTGDDEVDDTPPTTGHYASGSPWGATAAGACNATTLYDTSCTNSVTNLAKILLDTALSPMPGTDVNVGFDYYPRTNLTVQSIKIYPSTIGDEFEITHSKYNKNTNSYDILDVIKTKSGKVGKANLGASATQAIASHTNPDARASIFFNASKALWIDSFKIYPSTVGDSFTIQLLKKDNSVLKSYVGKTTTSSAAQTVPFAAFVPADNDYRLKITRNPGLRCDSIFTTTNYNIPGTINFGNELDTTGAGSGYRGRYNYFYDWSVRYDALTITDDTAQIVSLGYKVVPDTTYRIQVTKNPGLRHDEVKGAAYVRSVSCIIDIKNDTSAGYYNYLYDLNIRYGYIRNCIDYPDTVNTQNIMDYSNCPRMFTKQQVIRMRQTLASNTANRDRLTIDTTHVRTGILDHIGGSYGQRIDMKAVPEVSVERPLAGGGERTYFQCAERPFYFRNRSWRDTVTGSKFEFTNSPSLGSPYTQTTVNINQLFNTTFGQTGWVDVTMNVTDNNGRDTSVTFKNLVYAADGNNPVVPDQGFYMEFNQNDNNANANPDKWPMFNYYNNDHKWQLLDNVGFYDKTCISYRNYDSRITPDAYVGTPKGDYDDFFTPAFDLSGFTGDCNLNFMSSGAFRTSSAVLMKDTLEISYSTNCGQTWKKLKVMTNADIGNKGTVSIPYSPLWHGDWALRSYPIPAGDRGSKVFFRFRFKPGADDVSGGFASLTLPGTGNNFYIDRINISPYPTGVNTLLDNDRNIALAPNPTNGNTYVVIKNSSNETANIIVTDVTGKVVFQTSEQLAGSISRVEIPAAAIAVKGVYLVRVKAGENTMTEKLVSY